MNRRRTPDQHQHNDEHDLGQRSPLLRMHRSDVDSDDKTRPRGALISDRRLWHQPRHWIYSQPGTVLVVVVMLTLATVGALVVFMIILSSLFTTSADFACEQGSPRAPPGGLIPPWDDAAALQRLVRAINVDTCANGNDESLGAPDEGFRDLHELMRSSFPRVHATLDRVVLANHSLVYEWKGTAHASTRPIMLCAHQDTVPVGNVTAWTHPPLSGAIVKEREDDGQDVKWVWGRGTMDDKGQLFAIMEAVEGLLQVGFVPRRTILLAFGHDEETMSKGAHAISQYVAQKVLPGVKDQQLGLIIDEGTSIHEIVKTRLALIGTTEKGSLNLCLRVRVAGGHSSVPPRHTAIGMLAQMITAIEARPHGPRLKPTHPLISTLTCIAQHSKTINPAVRFIVGLIARNHALIDALLMRTGVADALNIIDAQTRSLLATTQAVDLVSGGTKINVLPEESSTCINHRVGIHESVESVIARLMGILEPVARSNGLTLTLSRQTDNGSHVAASETQQPPASKGGSLTVEILTGPIDPAPISPSVGAAPYDVIRDTIRHVFGESLIVSPIVMPANTDTRAYWALTRHIYRFGPIERYEGLHAVNERITVESFRRAVRFYHALIANYDRDETIDL